MKNKSLQPFKKKIVSQIQEIETNQNKVQALINYYSLLEFIENNQLGKAYLKKLESRNFFGFNKKKIKILKSFLTNESRDEFGYNRSKPGKSVSAHDIYLGDVYGIWTKTASYFISNKEKFMNEDSGVPNLGDSNLEFISVWYIINGQAEGLLECYLIYFNKKYKSFLEIM